MERTEKQAVAAAIKTIRQAIADGKKVTKSRIKDGGSGQYGCRYDATYEYYIDGVPVIREEDDWTSPIEQNSWSYHTYIRALDDRREFGYASYLLYRLPDTIKKMLKNIPTVSVFAE